MCYVFVWKVAINIENSCGKKVEIACVNASLELNFLTRFSNCFISFISVSRSVKTTTSSPRPPSGRTRSGWALEPDFDPKPFPQSCGSTTSAGPTRVSTGAELISPKLRPEIRSSISQLSVRNQ